MVHKDNLEKVNDILKKMETNQLMPNICYVFAHLNPKDFALRV